MSFSIRLSFFAASWAISLSPGAGAIAAMSAGLVKRGHCMTLRLILGIRTQLVLAARALSALRSPRHIKLMNRISGTLFIAAGSLLALLFKRA